MFFSQAGAPNRAAMRHHQDLGATIWVGMGFFEEKPQLSTLPPTHFPGQKQSYFTRGTRDR